MYTWTVTLVSKHNYTDVNPRTVVEVRSMFEELGFTVSNCTSTYYNPVNRRRFCIHHRHRSADALWYLKHGDLKHVRVTVEALE
jgi:hypothetical protein